MTRKFAYGYRSYEIDKLDYPEPKKSALITVRSRRPEDYRPPSMVSLGTHVEGYCPPHPDANDFRTMASGVMKRFARKTPTPDPLVLRDFREFVKKRIGEILKPLAPDYDISFEAWLVKCPYPEWRKAELREMWEENYGILKQQHFSVKSFMKDETYPEFKHARGINARHDMFKCWIGRFFKAIEEQLYEYPAFIKHVPVPDRPDYIMEMMHTLGGKYVATDYTAYESHFTKELMSIEFELYRYMTQYLPEHDKFMLLCNKVLAGVNHCQYKFFTVDLEATRMSGEMNTSLGNGFMNLMAFEYCCHVKGTQCVGVVEGDDGLFRIDGPAPTAEDFERIGFTIKIEYHDTLQEASFCGIIFDEDDRINITDPADVLLNFGWAGTRYTKCGDVRLKELLRAKSLSYLYQYSGCPVIQSLANYGLRMTKHIDLNRYLSKSRNISTYMREQYLEMMRDFSKIVSKPVPLRTRQLVEKKFGITVEMQISLEEYLDGLTQLEPLHHWTFMFIFNRDSCQYWHDYVRDYYEDYPQLSLKPYQNQLDVYAKHIVYKDPVSVLPS